MSEENSYLQVCVWPGTVVLNCDDAEHTVEDFEKWALEEFDTRVKYIEEIKTNPDPDDPETGGRNDLFFRVHEDDISKFAVRRLMYGIRWIEDVYYNQGGYLYPERVKEYCTWDMKEPQE